MASGQTFGDNTAPNNTLEYWDSATTSTLNNYRGKLIDNISNTNAVLNKIMATEVYEAANGGKRIVEELMYEMSTADTYADYDDLPVTRTDGITQAEFVRCSAAVPIMYSGREMRQNRDKFQILNIVKNRIMQAEMGLKEFFGNGMLQGNGAAALATPKVSGTNSSTFIDPLAKIIHYAPSSSVNIGGIDQSAYSWWRNYSAESAATSDRAFLKELDHMYNLCSRGPGGPPNLILMDQTTYELFVNAFFTIYRIMAPDEPNLPFEAKKFKKAIVTWDEKVPDVYSGAVAATTYGTVYFINTAFLKLRYDTELNFTLLRDDKGIAFQKPINGDYRVAHIGWEGAMTCSQRRKFGVLGKIARTLT